MVRVGRIDFANSDPVYYGLEHGDVPAGDVELIRGFPASLNSMLYHGDLDVAPISSIEYAKHPERYRVLPNLSVSSLGAVHSIEFFSHHGLDDLDGSTVALPSTSATSVVLLKILLEERYGVEPEYVTVHPDEEAMLERYDAALLIGDHALLAARRVDGVTVHDLGEEWRDFADDWMVYAVWAVHRDADVDGVRDAARTLERSKAVGEDNLDAIADDLADRLALPVDDARAYLDGLDHGFTPEQRRGLMKYYEHAARIDAIDAVPELDTLDVHE
jgi:chorismate dehydratase